MLSHRSFAASGTAALTATGLLLGSCSSPAHRPDSVAVSAAPDSVATATNPAGPANSPLQVVAEFIAPQMVGGSCGAGRQNLRLLFAL